MSNTKNAFMRIVAVVLIVTMFAPLAACSVVNDNPLLIKIGDVEVHLNEYASLFNSNLSTYSNVYDYSDSEQLIKYQDVIFQSLLEYAVKLYMANEGDLESTLTEEELADIETTVDEEMVKYAESFESEITVEEYPMTIEQLNEKYTLTEEEEESVQGLVDDAVEADLETYKALVDASVTGEEEILAEATKLRDEALEKDSKTYEQFLKEQEDDVRFNLLYAYYKTEKSVEVRDEYITDKLKMTVEEYEQEVRENATNDYLVEKVIELEKDKVVLDENAAQTWYDEKIAEFTDEYKAKKTDYYSQMKTYDEAAEDAKVVRPLYVPEGTRIVRVVHVLLKNAEEPATGEPATEPTTGEPATEPTTGEPATAPTTGEPATEPTTGEPATEPTTGEPATEPTTGEPTTEQPLTHTVDAEKIEAVEAAIAKIDPAADQIEAFKKIIDEFGEDEGMNNEPYSTKGYLAYEEISSTYVENFTEAALALENVGDISEAIVTTLGVHYLQLVEVVSDGTQGGVVPLDDEVKAEIEAYLLDEKQTEQAKTIVTTWIEECDAEHLIKRYTSRIRAYSGYSQYY